MSKHSILRNSVALSPLAMLLCASSALGQQYSTCAAAAAGSATVVPGGTYSGFTTAATTTTLSLACAGSGTPSRCVWFRFVPDQSGSIHLSFCGSSYDTLLSVHTGICPGPNAATAPCNDDSCGTSSELDVTVTAGTVYLIRVAGYNGATGAFTMNVSGYQTPPPPPSSGPDVAIWALTDYANYGTVAGTGVTAFAIGTTSTNYGDAPVDWRDEGVNNKSPVIAQNFYKLTNGRFTPLGQSWLKHGFASTNSGGGPGSCISPPLGGSQLGINCLDTYGSGLNGSQNYLGARSVVNATSGYFPPVTNGSFASGNAIFKRLQVQTADIETTGATYFGEAYYVTYDDACWGNNLNNCTYSQITTPTSTPNNVGTLFRRDPAVLAWGRADPSVVTVNADHTYTLISFGAQGDASSTFPTLPRDNTCRYIVAAKTTDNGNGTWHYEYVVYNHNSDRSAYSLSFRMPAGALVTGEGVSFPRSHSGEPYTNGNWIVDKLPGRLTFKADAGYAASANANAIRWGTMYTFWFDSNVPPITGGQAQIALFKPAYDGSHPSAGGPTGRVAKDLALHAFANALPVPRFCVADVASAGGADGPDGQLTADDVVGYLGKYFANDFSVADVASLGGVGYPDDKVTPDDLVYFLADFFAPVNCN